jgi:hypothetical protein
MRKIAYLLTGLLGSVGLAVAFALPASAATPHGVAPGSRVTNANANPVAGYIAVGSGPNVNFDHVETYAGAQDNIGDLALGLGNGAGIGLCQTNVGADTGSALQLGIIQVKPGVFQVAYGAGIIGPAPAAAQTNSDNCEDGALGNYITLSSVTDPGACPNADHDTVLSGVYTNPADTSDTTLVCTLGPTFSLGQVMELDLQYLHGEADFSVQNITGDNPGGWDTSGWFDVDSYIGSGVQFNEAVTGADADASALAPPADRTLFPAAHATLTSYTHRGHSDDTAFFDTSPFWTAVAVTSDPNANTADGPVLAPTRMVKGNYGVLEGSISS